MGGNVDEESAPPGADERGVTGAGADRERWPPSALRSLAGFAFKKANSVLKDEHAARDIAQVALAALVARPDPPPDPRGWVGIRAAWLALNELRRRRREERKSGRLAQYAVRPPEDFTNRVAARLLLDEILAALPPQDRMALELEYLLGYPRATVADFMGISEQALKKRQQRALAKARVEYERLTAEGWEQ